MSKVSVVIPMYNAAQTIVGTLSSALAQSYADLEIVVVDDGSTDGCADYVSRISKADQRVRLIRQKNAGVAAARNNGIAHAQGYWIALLDADDLWHSDKIAMQVSAAQDAPVPPSFVYAWSRRIDIDDNVLLDLGQPGFEGDVVAALVASNFMRNSSVPLIGKNALEAVGGYDSSLQKAGAHGAEDLDIYLKLAEYGPVALAPAFLVGYRHFPGQMSGDPERMRRSIDLVLNRFIAGRPDIPASLIKLAQMNYDFYCATLYLSNKDYYSFSSYLGNALMTKPLDGLSILACYASSRLKAVFVRGGKSVAFQDLAVGQSLGSFSMRLVDRLQSNAVFRAVERAEMRVPRWKNPEGL